MNSASETFEVKKGQTLYHKGSPVKQMAFVKSGRIKASDNRIGFTIESGQIAGILDASFDIYNFSYVAVEDSTVILFPYSDIEDIEIIMRSYNNYATLFVKQITGYINEYLNYLRIFINHSVELKDYITNNYGKYQTLCADNKIAPLPYTDISILNNDPDISSVDPLTVSYYHGVSHMPKNISDAYYKCSPGTAAYIISEASNFVVSLVNDVQSIKDYVFDLRNNLINDRHEDFLKCLCELAFDLTRSGKDVKSVIAMVNELSDFIISSKLYDANKTSERIKNFKTELTEIPVGEIIPTADNANKTHVDTDPEKIKLIIKDSINTILKYSETDEDTATRFKSLVHTFKNFKDRSDTGDNAMKTRKEITKLYYDIYESILVKAIHDSNVPTIISMFLNFGYIDEQLVGIDNAIQIYGYAENIHELNSEHIFTIFEWFKAIYTGRRDPSKNDFDLDYPAYLRDEKKSGRITAAQLNEYMNNMDMRLNFEMRNFFISANRVTCGRISTFCPLLSDDVIIKPLAVSCLNASKVDDTLNKIRSIDFSAFYREVMYSDIKHGLDKEFVQQEVLPDIILFPNSGTKGHMWQELGNSKRNTPARFAMPVILQEELLETLVGLVGRYRWEICRRIQGARWNDLSEKSLTAEYCDYVQFYKKNRDLSDQAKEKLKSSLQKARNSTRELFAKDYEQWIIYESKGASRLNKVARRIIFTYCPFSKEYRTTLSQSPMFKELLERYAVQTANKKKRAEGVNLKVSKNGGIITPPLQTNLEFYDM